VVAVGRIATAVTTKWRLYRRMIDVFSQLLKVPSAALALAANGQSGLFCHVSHVSISHL
jgi:hypothetical protein